MTAAAHALGMPVPIRRPRVDTVDVCRKPITRQDRARRAMFKVAAGFLGLVVVATGQQVAAHGWKAFVLRAPGVGGTPARADAAASATASDTGSGVVSTTPAVSMPPTHRSRGHHRGATATPVGLPPLRGIVSVGDHTHHRASATGRVPVIYVPAPAIPPTTTPSDPPTSPLSSNPPGVSAPTSLGGGSEGDGPTSPPEEPPTGPPPPGPRPPGHPPRPPRPGQGPSEPSIEKAV